jgi:hypothetical protein
MPSLAEYLHHFADSYSRKAPQLEAELSEVETRKREIEKELNAAHLALDRAGRFIPVSGLQRYCPHCWILHERTATLRSVPSNRPRVDLYRCNGCDFEYEVET